MKQLPGILLVEDDRIDAMNVERSFKKNNIQNPLHIATNGSEALKMLRGRNRLPVLPKFAILDINMPRMNGFELLHEIREDESLADLTVFMMTASNEETDKLKAYQYNVAGFIVKPLSFDQFSGAIVTLANFLKLIQR